MLESRQTLVSKVGRKKVCLGAFTDSSVTDGRLGTHLDWLRINKPKRQDAGRD